ncbi:MAG: hypothetical protein QNJ31_02610 [Candidatus Caenarcaniphilales bacterium]|nr:hypothetical protein [Candidatus Caenarcaniphilales bacterium]
MRDLTNKSPYECYEEILKKIKEAQKELSKQTLIDYPDNYIEILKEAKTHLEDISRVVPEWTDKSGMLILNLRLLNNYYKHLFTRAIEDRCEESLSELRYHICELIAAWKNL